MPRPVPQRHGGYLREDLEDWIGYARLRLLMNKLGWDWHNRQHFTPEEVWALLTYHHLEQGDRKVIKLHAGADWEPGQRSVRPLPPEPPREEDADSPELKRRIAAYSRIKASVKALEEFPDFYEGPMYRNGQSISIAERGRLLRR